MDTQHGQPVALLRAWVANDVRAYLARSTG